MGKNPEIEKKYFEVSTRSVFVVLYMTSAWVFVTVMFKYIKVILSWEHIPLV